MRSLLPNLKWIDAPDLDVVTSDDDLSREVADQLLVGDPEEPYQGFFLDGFPFNTQQALLLDRHIKGINLAIYFRDEEDTEE